MNLKRIFQRLRNRGRADADLEEEIASFYDGMQARRIEAGLTPGEARRETRAEFGSPARVVEAVRDSRVEAVLETAIQDIRYAWRGLRRNPGFAAVAVLTLALGIGANSAIYSLMESILLRSLPVAGAESLVVLNWHSRPPRDGGKDWVHVMQSVSGFAWKGGHGSYVSGMFPYGAFETLREENGSLSVLFGHFRAGDRTLSIGGAASSAGGEYVTGEYFRALAVRPAAGRLIGPEDDKPGAPPVAVVSFATSQNRFGGPAKAVGQPILVDNVPFTVVGVAPPEFRGVDPAWEPGVYLPLRANLLLDGSGAASMYGNGNFYWIELMGRLRPGVTLEQAQSAMAPRFRQWVSTTATTDGERAKLPELLLTPGAGGLNSLRRDYSKPLYVLLAMVGLILTIACANIANLLLARASARRREISVRLSLGASRWRVVRQLITESLLLASLGGILGVVLAHWGTQWLTVLLTNGRENFTLGAGLNWFVLAATAALTMLCGLLFGLAPALQATRPDVMPALKNGRAGEPRGWTQQALVVAQLALSLIVLVAAGLFVRTLNNLHSVQLGYARENILLFSVDARKAGHRDPEIVNFYSGLRRRFEAIPGVSGATLSQSSLIRAGHARGAMKVGETTVEGTRVLVTGANFHSTMRIPMLYGREIDDRDQPGSAPVAVISERLARTYFDGRNPIGHRIAFLKEKRELEIVGVSANLRYGSLKGENPMTVFIAASQVSLRGMTYALRTAGDPLRHASNIRDIVKEADSRIPVTNIVSQAAEIDRTIGQEVAFAKLCTGFAALALLISCIGLYGTMSCAVARRINEIGIRMALGARRGAVVWMVLRRVLVLVLIGIAISVPAALAASQLVESLLFETKPNDPAILALAGVILAGAGILAGYLPARRASKIDPLVALRHE
ncbi:MAG: ABC transporter permease [Acidobacteria bacterium]|nr:ABC transporter permease [Acidobacteriota bacterium]